MVICTIIALLTILNKIIFYYNLIYNNIIELHRGQRSKLQTEQTRYDDKKEQKIYIYLVFLRDFLKIISLTTHPPTFHT